MKVLWGRRSLLQSRRNCKPLRPSFESVDYVEGACAVNNTSAHASNFSALICSKSFMHAVKSQSMVTTRVKDTWKWDPSLKWTGWMCGFIDTLKSWSCKSQSQMDGSFAILEKTSMKCYARKQPWIIARHMKILLEQCVTFWSRLWSSTILAIQSHNFNCYMHPPLHSCYNSYHRHSQAFQKGVLGLAQTWKQGLYDQVKSFLLDSWTKLQLNHSTTPHITSMWNNLLLLGVTRCAWMNGAWISAV